MPDRIADPWGERTPYGPGTPWPVRVDVQLRIAELFRGPPEGGLGLLRDLHDLYLLVASCDVAWTVIGQAAKGARDAELGAVVDACDGETTGQLQWPLTRMKQAAPQALVVA